MVWLFRVVETASQLTRDLEQDTDVAEILAWERGIYQYHPGADPSQVLTFLFQQALRQDPGLYALTEHAV